MWWRRKNLELFIHCQLSIVKTGPPELRTGLIIKSLAIDSIYDKKKKIA